MEVELIIEQKKKKKTESLYQPARGNAYVPPVVSIKGKQLNAVENFKYLGGIVSNDASIDKEITARIITKATSALGRLTKRLLTNKGITLDTKNSCLYNLYNQL